MNPEKLLELKKFALKIRIAEIEEFKSLGFGHIGGSLSITDALAVLYGAVMKIDPKNPSWSAPRAMQALRSMQRWHSRDFSRMRTSRP